MHLREDPFLIYMLLSFYKYRELKVYLRDCIDIIN